MIPEAAEALHSECIPAAVSKYHGYSGFMSLLGMLLTHLVQVLAMRAMSRLLANKHASEGDSEKTVDNKEKDDRPVDHEHDHSHGGLLVHSHKKASIYLLEGGITSHSIIIGVALGVAREDFTILLTAIAFHQFFEGIALSAIVLEAEFKKKLIAWVMVLFYTLSTPIGIAIGVGVAQVYNDNAGDTLMAIASLDSLSAGILIYDVVANILSPHFNRQSFMELKGWHQGTQLLFLWVGAATMAVIGIWA